MPEPGAMLKAMAAAAFTAAAVILIFSWPWRTAHPVRTAAGSVLGVAAGLFVGSWLLGLRPHWPPTEALDRLLYILLPAAILVELLATFLGRLRWLAWLPRLAVAATAARVLLHDSTFISDQNYEGKPEWSPERIWQILGGLAIALAAVWLGLVLLARRTFAAPAPDNWMARTKGWSVPLVLAMACAGAAVTAMLSGSATDAQMGLPLAAALAGFTFTSLFLKAPPDPAGVIGVGTIGLFGLVVIGIFFARLTAVNAVLLFCGPLLCWLPEAPPRFRGAARVAAAAVPVVVALALAQQKFVDDSAAKTPVEKELPPGGYEPTAEDYLNIGK
jgi:hypothetical protein